MNKRVKVGVIGCGGICRSTYMENMVNNFNVIDVVGCADLIDARAEYIATKYNVKKMTVEEMMNNDEIQIVVILTNPESHFMITSEAFKHKKYVYCEKMMACSFEDALELAKLAEQNNLMYTTAPDTFLGAWEQSARKYIDDGIIGRPVTVHAQVTSHYEPETPFFDTKPRHFFFSLHPGGGFPFDLGGYYLHQMINLFGTIKRVSGFGGNINPRRIYTNPKHPKYKEEFQVNTPTTLVGSLEFENGVFGTVHFSSDSFNSRSFVVTGSDGTFNLGDPNCFASKISVCRRGAAPGVENIAQGTLPTTASTKQSSDDECLQQLGEPCPEQTVELPLLHGFYTPSRGVGVADMCYVLLNDRRPRCHYDIGLHAIEVIHGLEESAKTGKIYEMTTKCPRPAPLAASAYTITGQETTLDN